VTSLVTGATGFIGGHVARRLVHEGHRVRCLVRATSDTSQLEGLDVEIVVGDLTSPRSLAQAADGCRHVVHCAALVSDWATREEIERVNVDGTRNLLAAAASAERFVHFSSTDVYGHPGGPAIDETYAPAGFRNWYAATKLAAEAEIVRAPHAVILRPATVYGPRSEAVIGEIARAIRGRHMVLIGQGRAVAGLTYVENLVDAAVLALTHDAAPRQAFNVSDGLAVTWRKLVDDLADGLGCPRVRGSLPYPLASVLGVSLEHGYRALRRTTGLSTRPLLSRQAVQVMGIDQSFSNAKARELLGWEPRVGYTAGLEATLAWLRRSSPPPPPPARGGARSPRASGTSGPCR
jgi:nucleoside-diphosphate-sugar epimerase